ncbi:hypothetical protein TNCV_301981 [Trichonephila clavipes]|nr:hypothetical protein TNCV_301981 [Trichonephila clavipes]
MGVCKYIVPLRHGGTLNSRRASSPLVRLGEREVRWKAPNPPQGCSSSKLGWNRTKSYCHLYGAQGLRLTTGVHLAPCHDEFCGSGSDTLEINWHKK